MRRRFFIALAVMLALLSAFPASAQNDRGKLNYATPPDIGSFYTMKYQMDDVYGNSGSRGQWIVVVSSRDVYPDNVQEFYDRWETRGGKLSDYTIWTSANLIRNHPYVWSINGWHEPPFRDAASGRDGNTMPIRYFFMVIPRASASVSIDFSLDPDAIPSVDQTYALDVSFGNDAYTAVMTAYGEVKLNPRTNRYKFDLTKKTSPDTFGTERTYLSFHNDPQTPSQTTLIPVVIANVAMGPARDKPLELDITVRESDGTNGLSGQLVSTQRMQWDVTSDKDVKMSDGTSNWIFVRKKYTDPEGKTATRSYTITADIKNYSGLRYGVQRYDRMPVGIDTREIQTDIFPKEWRFDLDDNVHTDIDTTIELDPKSHIAPGLISRYRQNFNIDSLRQKIMRIYPVDRDDDNIGPHDLWITHNSVAGYVMGNNANTGIAVRDGSGLYRANAEAFFYDIQGENFLNREARGSNVAEVLELFSKSPSRGEGQAVVDAVAEMPNPIRYGTLTSGIVGAMNTASGSEGAGVAELRTAVNNVPASAVADIWVSVPVPEYLQYRSDDETHNKVGVLPMHFTFNIPGDAPYITEAWDALLAEWRRSGNIDELFQQLFHVFSRTHDDAIVRPREGDAAEIRNRDLTNWLKQRGAYGDNVRVMLDETNKLITVELFAMLVNSNWVKYGLLTDTPGSSTSSLGVAAAPGTRQWLTIMDGHGREGGNTKWDMGFYIRAMRNDSGGGTGGGGGTSTSGGGGGGCAAGASIAALMVLACALKFYGRR